MSQVIAWGQTISRLHSRPPGNSIPAIEHIYDIGYDGIEVDIQITKDGIPILMHNATIDHETSGTGALSELNFEDLEHLSLRKSTVPIAKLSEALQVNGTQGKIFLDCRPADRQPIIDTIIQSGLDHSLFHITAHGLENAKKFKRDIPSVPVLCKYYRFPSQITNEDLNEISSNGIDGIMLKMPLIDEPAHDFVEKCHKLGLSLTTFVHTHKNTEEEFRQLIKADVDYILTENHHFISLAKRKCSPHHSWASRYSNIYLKPIKKLKTLFFQ